MENTQKEKICGEIKFRQMWGKWNIYFDNAKVKKSILEYSRNLGFDIDCDNIDSQCC